MALKLDEPSYRLMESSVFEVLITSDVSAESLVQFFLKLFEEQSLLIPSRFDPYGPIKTKYTRASFEKLIQHEDIDCRLMLRGEKLSYSFDRSRNSNGGERWTFRFDLKIIPLQVALEVVDFVTQLPFSIAMLHVVSIAEAAYCKKLKLGWDQGEGYSFHALFLDLLSLGVPTLAWRTYFGPMYIRHFGKERLLSAPAYAVKEVHPDVISIQLTESIQTIDADWERFHAARQRVIAHLGPESFQRVREAGDPPPMGEYDRNGVPGTSIPPELRDLRRKIEEQFKRDSQPQPPAVEDLDEMAKDPKRFRVVEIKVGKKGKDTVVVDTYREEMIGFADPAMRDRYVRQLLDAGAEFKKMP